MFIITESMEIPFILFYLLKAVASGENMPSAFMTIITVSFSLKA